VPALYSPARAENKYRRSPNFAAKRRISGSNRNVSQDCADACADFRDVLMDVRLVADDGIPIDKEELLLWPSAAMQKRK